AFDICKIAKTEGLYNNFVTNGYMSKEFLKDISEFLDAANVDLKGNEEFYQRLPQANQKYVVENIELMKKLNIWVEVTTLLIPEYNDKDDQIRDIARKIKNIDKTIPWHISRFFPHYKMSDHYTTEIEKVRRAREIGYEEGLLYVYTGNIVGDEGENTYCPYCKKLLIERYGYRIIKNEIKDNKCGFCGEKIDGIFKVI
ncbi:MAG: radical SAM protein, partial [Candidatus Omnitrophica bacterium]|nr:radical SAM protein [Candidatus Omnitrophota bacterium]